MLSDRARIVVCFVAVMDSLVSSHPALMKSLNVLEFMHKGLLASRRATDLSLCIEGSACRVGALTAATMQRSF